MSTPNTHFGSAEIQRLMKKAEKIFFIGIGGVNMSSLAEITKLSGYTVSGSDRSPSDITGRLEQNGIEIFYGHDAAHVEDCDIVVYTIAINPDNPEYDAAMHRGIPCISRADYLGFIMTGYKTRIGICGMHGKSTTTSMAGFTFAETGADPTVICGANMPDLGGYYRIGSSEYFIFEACEYKDSFLSFCPTAAVILNIELDHVDYFENLTQVRHSFAEFAALTGPRGIVLANWDDENVRLALGTFRGMLITFGAEEESDAEWRAVNIDMSRGLPSFDMLHEGEFTAHIDLSVPGRHNIYNASAAFISAVLAGIPAKDAADALGRFSGAERRMEYKGRFLGADVYDDYGHHPTEISATLRGAKEMGYDRVFCAFQPHTYSRTAGLFDDFAASLRIADAAFLVDIYAAREADVYGVSSEKLARAVGKTGIYSGTLENTVELLKNVAAERTAIIIMGAGDINKIFPLMELEN